MATSISDRWPWRISPAAIAHGSALLGLYFAVKAWSYALDRFLLLYNDNGVVVGAGYTDVHVELPVLWLLICVAAAAAIVAWANVRLRTYRLAIAAAVLVFGSSFVFAEVVPGLFERFYVKPSELQLEAPYIQRNIALTREAYNLRQIAVKPFPAEQGSDLPVAAGQPRDHRQYPAVGLAAADGHLRAIAGDPHLLQVPRCRCRSLPYRRFLSAGDALGARARAVAAVGQRADLGQPASAVHPRQRGRDVAGHPEIHGGPAEFLSEGHPAGRLRWSRDDRAAHLFRAERRAAM